MIFYPDSLHLLRDHSIQITEVVELVGQLDQFRSGRLVRSIENLESLPFSLGQILVVRDFVNNTEKRFKIRIQDLEDPV